MAPAAHWSAQIRHSTCRWARQGAAMLARTRQADCSSTLCRAPLAQALTQAAQKVHSPAPKSSTG